MSRSSRPSAASRWNRWHLAAAVLTLLVLGGVFAQWAIRREDRRMREELLRQTYIVAQAISIDRVQALDGDLSDEHKPEYRRLKEQLMAAAQINPAWEWIYLMGRTEEGTLFFQMDSEAYDVDDPSPPGQVYDEASPELHGVFDAHLATTEGPIPDRWGVWVSAFVPLLDPRTGDLVTVLGIDIEAGTWRARTWRAGLVPGALTLLLLTILVTGYAMRGSQDAATGVIKRRWNRLEAYLSAATGLALTWAAVWHARSLEQRHQQEAFLALAHIKSDQILNAVRNIRNSEIESLGRFFENSEVVEPVEFRNYADYLNQIPDVRGWGWVPVVAASDREAFEQQARAEVDPDYRLWERHPDGQAIPALARESHFPVLYLHPPGLDSFPDIARGVDLASIDSIRQVLESAKRSGMTTATEAITPQDKRPVQPHILVFRPVMNGRTPGQLQGFVLAMLKPDHLMHTVLSANLDRNPFIHMELLELSKDAPPRRLATTFPAGADLPDLLPAPPSCLCLMRPILAFGRTYAVAAHPTADFLAGHSTRLAGLVLLAGLSITAAATLMITFVSHRRETMERLVDERTYELASSMRRLDLLAHENKAAAERYRVLISASNTGAWEYNDQTAHLWASPEYFAMLGRDPAGFQVGSNEPNIEAAWLDLMHPDDRENALTAFTRYLKNPEAMYEQRFRMRHADGHWVWVLSRGRMLRDADGRPTPFIVGTHIDITETQRSKLFREMGVQTLQILNEPDDLQLLLERLAGMFKAHTEFDAVGIRLQAGNQFPYVAQEGFSCEYMDPENDLLVRDESGPITMGSDGRPTLRCACGMVLSGEIDSRKPCFTRAGSCWTNDAARIFPVAEKGPGSAPCLRDGFASIALVPIPIQGRVVGLLQFNDRRKDQFSPEIIDILEDIATHVGEAILRKRAEQDYRTLFHEMLEGFAVHEILCDKQGRPVDYRFLAVNPAFENMTGLKSEQIAGRTVREVLPETEPEWIEIFGRVALTGEPAFFQQYSATLGKHFEVTAFRPGPRQFACIFSDITDRKRAEEELRESRRQYAALLANLPGMAYRCANDRSWTMDFVSEGCRELTGYAPEDLVGNRMMSFSDLVVPHHREHLWEQWQQQLRDHRKFEDEYQITTRSGEIKWVWEQGEGIYDEAGNVLALEGFIADITERKLANLERERLMAAIEQSGDTILITDDGGAIVYVNPAFEQVTGYSREEALSQNPRILQSGRHDHDFYRRMWQTLSAGRMWQGQIENRRKDGSLYTELASISPVRDAAGRIAHFVAVKRDITRQLQDQEDKENLQAQLLQAQKMESIGRLAGGIAHDFNNMLQAILGYAEMGLEQVPPDQPLHGDLLEIQKAARRSAALTRQLQAFARKQTANPRILDLNAAVEGLTGMLRPLMGEGIDLVWSPDPDLGRIRVDPGHLDQLLTNLCINARDAITAPGRIVVETRNLDVEHPIRNLHGDIPPGTYVQLSVEDNGCGMTPDVLEHMFEPFFTTKNVGKGTGLGLATAYGLIQQNRGIPRVLSRPGQGTTFQVFFPRMAGDTPSPIPEEENPAALEALRGSETVLIVEDEDALLQTARRMLESLGYTVRAFTSPNEALRMAEKEPDRFDLLLTDVIMPGMNGPELVQRILTWRPGLVYLFMSGYTANLIAEHGVKETSANFIHKPFSRIQLAGMVRKALDLS